MGESTVTGPHTHPDCICPHGVRPLGRLYGVSMGKGVVRLKDEPGCPVHDPSTHEFTPAEPKPWSAGQPLCVRCHVPERRHGNPRGSGGSIPNPHPEQP